MALELSQLELIAALRYAVIALLPTRGFQHADRSSLEYAANDATRAKPARFRVPDGVAAIALLNRLCKRAYRSSSAIRWMCPFLLERWEIYEKRAGRLLTPAISLDTLGRL